MRRLATALLLLGTVVPARAALLRVPEVYPSVAAGLAASAPGDTVELACGTYHEHGLVLRPGVVLRGENGVAACVVIDADSSERIASAFGTGAGTVVEGITFQNGYEPNGLIHGRVPGDDVTRETRGELPERDLGGGGAFYLSGAELTIRRCGFVHNEVVAHGGALRIRGGHVRLEDAWFAQNVAGGEGGAFHATDGAVLEIVSTTFRANRALRGGAGFANLATIDGTGAVFESNRADAAGGAVQLADADAVFRGTVFLTNTASRGGALSHLTRQGHTLTLEECTLAANGAPVGAALSGAATLRRCIVAFQQGGYLAECARGAPALECCDVFGNSAGDYAQCLTSAAGTAGNFRGDPLFCNLDAGLVQLDGSSPCAEGATPCGSRVGAFDTGCASAVPFTVDTDPTGLRVLVDGESLVAPVSGLWAEGSLHTLGVASPQDTGTGRRATFLSWSDGGGAAHSVTASPGMGPVVASFRSEVRLSMLTDGPGSVTPGTSWQPEGAPVDIAALPDAGAGFARWVGAGAGSYSGTAATAVVAMSEPVTETAYFAAGGVFHLTVTATPGGSVAPASGAWPPGSSVTIEATPDAGWDFGGWHGTGTGSYSGPAAVRTIDLWDDVTEAATFVRRTYRVTMVATVGGSVSPATGDFGEGDSVAILATALPGYSFVEWVGQGAGSYSGTSAAASIRVLERITQTAYFEGPPAFHLTMVAGPGGQVAPESADYPNGNWVRIHATPDPGFLFDHWTGQGAGSYSGTVADADVRMLGDVTETASFRPPSLRTLTIQAGPGGTVSPPPGPHEYYETTTVTLTALPAAGFRFAGWNGSGRGSYTGSANPISVTLTTQDIVEYALFAPSDVEVEVTISADPLGVPILVDGVSYVTPHVFNWQAFSLHDLEAPDGLPPEGGERLGFLAWNDGLPHRVRVLMASPGYALVRADYREQVLVSQPVPEGGVPLPGDTWIARGDTLQIEAVPDLNWVFAGWAGEGAGAYSGPENHVRVIPQDPVTETARFEPLGFEYSLSASDQDPWVNSVAASGAPRPVHLWLTCADHGIAAMEATVQISGDLQMLGFQPASGILNAGDATHLLLAIGGCPSGAQMPVRLGSWVFMDGGGSVCLTEAEAGGFSAVTCEALHSGQAMWPVVHGFSSDGSAPCTAGEHGCPDGAIAARGALRSQGEPAVSAVQENGLSLAPNPFRGTTRIVVALTEDSPVRLDVYDVSGRLVRRLAGEPLPAGVHTRTWDARDPAGRPVPAGIYFVRLDTASGFRATRKVVHLGAR